MGPALADSPSPWYDLAPRVLSAAVMMPVAIAGVWFGGVWFTALVAVAAAGLSAEWACLCGIESRGWRALLTGGLIWAAFSAGGGGPFLALAVLAAGAVVCVLAVDRRLSRRGFAFAFPYFGPAAIGLAWMREDPAAGLANTLFLLSVVWASDIAAYIVGRLIGGPKLAPAISPGKTWSGAAGGLFAAGGAGLGVAACFSSGYSPSKVVLIAIGLGVVAELGDLFESGLKRDFGVKDSGRIIPGHGGLLDRLDALLAAAPAAALLAFTVGRGVVLWR